MFWVILLIFVISYFLLIAVEVDNTVINEVDAVNYNGYFEVAFEDKMRSIGFISSPVYQYTCYAYSTNLDAESFTLFGFGINIYQEVTESLHTWLFVDFLMVEFNTIVDEYYVHIVVDGIPYDYVELEYMPLIEIYGISNYGVTS